MIVSFSRSFVFIRTRKTASTSTEIVLGAWCGNRDIVTPVGVDDELTRLSYGGGPRNFCTDPELEVRYRQTLSTRDRSVISLIYKKILQNLDFHHHMSVGELKPRIAPAFWSRAFKFAVDRHPYEKVISIAYWRHRKLIRKGAAVRGVLEEVIEQGDYCNFDLYTIDGHVAVDRVFRYEELWAEMSKLAATLGTTLPLPLPQAKGHYRRDRRPATLILSREQKRRVQEVCAKEFDLLNYEP